MNKQDCINKSLKLFLEILPLSKPIKEHKANEKLIFRIQVVQERQNISENLIRAKDIILAATRGHKHVCTYSDYYICHI